MAIKTDTFSSAGGGAGTDTLDDVTGRGATTTNAVTVGGVTIGTEYSLPTADGTDGQVVVTNGTGTLSFTTLDFTGGLEYKGSFNATAGTPSLLNAEKGDFYIIDTAGTIYGQTWAVGDHLLINEDMGGTITNSKIDKIDNTQAVTSVNTQTGAVVLSGNDLAADHTATNYTPADANIDGHLSGIDTKLGTLLADITGESLNDLSDVSYTAGAGIDNYVLTYDNGGTSWGAEAVVNSINTQTGAVTLSGDDLAADHTASNYTPANANIDGHLSGIDSALGASATPTLDGVTTNGNTTTNAINVGTITTSGDILADSDASRTIGAEATRFITYHGDMNGAIRFKAKNNQGTAISKGQVVYISGVSGTVPEVKLAKADSASTMPAFGLALADANDQAEVQIITFGNLTSVNTTTYSLLVNDTVFVSAATAGALVNSAPTGEGNLIQNIGRVVRADASAGIIKVGGAGRSAATPNLNDGNIFIGNASNQSSTTALSGVAVTSFNTATGDLTIGGDDLTADHTAVNYTAANANIDGHFSGVDTKLGTLLADITGESLNDLSDVSFTAGAGIDGNVLAYDNTAGEWQAVARLSAVVDDTAPQLGGDLDTNSNEIVTASNANLILRPNGTGHVFLGGNTNPAELRLYCESADAHYVGLKSPAHSELSGSQTWRLPVADGTSGQAITTDGSGNLTFSTISGGGGGYTYSAITADPANAQYDYHYSCTGTFTVTLPASASGDAGKEIRIKNMGTGTITIDGNASETIDGQTTIDLDVQYSSITLVATGNTPAAWEIV